MEPELNGERVKFGADYIFTNRRTSQVSATPESEDPTRTAPTTDSRSIEEIVKGSFLARVPQIMERGGFTLEQAIEAAYREEEKMMLELIQPRSEKAEWARVVVRELSDRVYARLSR